MNPVYIVDPTDKKTLLYKIKECIATASLTSRRPGKLKNRLVIPYPFAFGQKSHIAKIAANILTKETFQREMDCLKSSSRLSAFRYWVPVTLFDQHLKINIASIAKRLDTPKEAIYKAAKDDCTTPGTFHQFLQEKSGLKFLQIATNEVFELSSSSCLQIFNFVKTQRNDLHTSILRSSLNSIYIGASTDLLLPIQINRDGSVFIHFPQQRLPSQRIQHDMYLAIDFDTGEMLMIKQQRIQPNSPVPSARLLKALQGSINILKLKQATTAPWINKDFFVYSYNTDNLADALEQNKLTVKDGLYIISDILTGSAFLSDQGIVHRDLCLENIYLCRKNNRLQALIGGFESAGFTSDNNITKFSRAGTQDFGSPEWAVTGHISSCFDSTFYNESLDHASSDKQDAWAIGSIIRKIIGLPFPIINIHLNNNFTFVAPIEIHYLLETCLPYIETSPLASLIYDLINDLQNENPNMRLSAKESLQKYQDRIQTLLKLPPEELTQGLSLQEQKLPLFLPDS
ncbi:MAG: protein kinase [Chlamydiales bacterium]|nr:protein kinase [Chlamydiales bacterium]